MEINARKLFILKHGHFLKSDRLKALLAHVVIFLFYFARSSTHDTDRRHPLCLPFQQTALHVSHKIDLKLKEDTRCSVAPVV